MIKKFHQMNENMGYTDFFGKEVSHNETLQKSIRDNLVQIVVDERKISEKSFKEYDSVISEVEKLCETNETIYTKAQEYYTKGKRLSFLAEELYDEYYRAKNLTKNESLLDDFDYYESYTMPFGKHEGKLIKEVPVSYLKYLYDSDVISIKRWNKVYWYVRRFILKNDDMNESQNYPSTSEISDKFTKQKNKEIARLAKKYSSGDNLVSYVEFGEELIKSFPIENMLELIYNLKESRKLIIQVLKSAISDYEKGTGARYSKVEAERIKQIREITKLLEKI